jgi:hypothetical protein
LLSPLPIDFRPDKVHFIITGEDAELRCQFIDVDPNYPDALNAPNGRALVQMARMGGYRDIVVTIAGVNSVISDVPGRPEYIMAELHRRQKLLDKK